MKKYIKSLPLLFLSVFVSLAGFGQDKKEVDITIGTEKNDNFFAQPWVWIVGAAVFILLLVAILRSGSKSTE
ncbi:MAG TPA: hypothetical protein VGD33_08230 [Chitinophagaceae bacterium]|jgi:hypothetical protein